MKFCPKEVSLSQVRESSNLGGNWKLILYYLRSLLRIIFGGRRVYLEKSKFLKYMKFSLWRDA